MMTSPEQHRAFDRQLAKAGGGEPIHPDHAELREAVRVAVLAALDAVAAERGIAKASDAELPALFRALDPIAQRMFLASVGLGLIVPTPPISEAAKDAASAAYDAEVKRAREATR